MKVARKKNSFRAKKKRFFSLFATLILVGGLSFGVTYYFAHDDIEQTFAKIEETIEESEIVKVVEKITNPEKVSENEETINKTTEDIKAQYERREEERLKLERELEKDRELKKNVEEAKKRLEDFEREYEESLKTTEPNPEEVETLENTNPEIIKE